MTARIERLAEELKRRYRTADPDELAEALGIHVYERPDFSQLLGLYAVVRGRRCVFLNAALGDRERRVVLAHEIGHDQLHREEAEAGMPEFSLSHMDLRTEYEANVFAAHLLLDEREVDRAARDGMDVVSIAQNFGVDINLVLVKLHEMKRKGYEVRVQDSPQADFLGFREARGE